MGKSRDNVEINFLRYLESKIFLVVTQLHQNKKKERFVCVLITSLDKVQQNDLPNYQGRRFNFYGVGGKSYFLHILGPFSPKQGGEQVGETASGWGFPPVSYPQTPI